MHPMLPRLSPLYPSVLKFLSTHIGGPLRNPVFPFFRSELAIIDVLVGYFAPKSPLPIWARYC